MKKNSLKENMKRFNTKNLKEQSKKVKWPNLKDGEYIIKSAKDRLYGNFRLRLEDRYGNMHISWDDYPAIMSNKSGIYYYSNGRKFWTHEDKNWDQKFKVRSAHKNIVSIKSNHQSTIFSITQDPYTISLEQMETMYDAPEYTYKISGLPLPKDYNQ